MYIFSYCVGAHPSALPNSLIAGPALVRVPVLTEHEVGIHRDFPWAQIQDKQFVWQREKSLFGRPSREGSPGIQLPASVCSSTHWRNFSLGTTMRVPIFRTGKPSLWSRSYAPAWEIPSTWATSSAFKNSGRSS